MSHLMNVADPGLSPSAPSPMRANSLLNLIVRRGDDQNQNEGTITSENALCYMSMICVSTLTTRQKFVLPWVILSVAKNLSGRSGNKPERHRNRRRFRCIRRDFSSLKLLEMTQNEWMEASFATPEFLSCRMVSTSNRQKRTPPSLRTCSGAYPAE